MLARGAGKAARGLRVAVHEGQVGLDVVDGRAVEHVRAAHAQDGAILAAVVDALQPHAGKADGIGAEGCARGEHAHAHIAASRGGRTEHAI